MHILIVHNDYAKFSGEEHAVETMASVLESHGHHITWFRKSSAEIGDSAGKKLGAFFSGIYSFKSKKEISRILDKKKIDIVQVQNLYPFLSPSVLSPCGERKIPVVMRCPNYRLFCPSGLHLRGGQVCELCLGGNEFACVVNNCEQSLPKSLGYAIRARFGRTSGLIAKNVSIFIVLSEFQKKRFVAGGIHEKKIAILPNIAPLGNGAMAEGDNGVISFVGRISKEKGISQFVEAARTLPQYRFAVAGNTDAIPGIESQASSNLTFHGFLKGDRLDDFFKTSRILVFPSTWFEGFPNVIAKAMAYGKPVIASRIGALAEIVEDGVTGLLFEPGNAEDLAEKIDYLWNRPALCAEMGHAGLQKARKEYSEERYYERLMDIYKKALSFQR
ncbi:MAG TPA: glycosyltransferase family 1 protein [Proteobacteria bacterium]|nr:glycosyltransferase family 1 protein [Pseudomonadota bacterium]